MALLTGRPQAPDSDSVEESRMSVIEHLEALRRALIVAVVAWAICTIIAFFFWQPIFRFLLHRARIQHAVFLEPTGGFFLGFHIALYVGAIAAAPIIFWQAWSFVGPGLHRHERRLVLPLVIATTFFFAVGVGFALFALPLVVKVLTGFAPPELQFLPTGDAILSFVLALILGFGLVFELPVVLYLLGQLGIISSRWLYKNRAYWIIGMGLLANILTPGGDPLTPLIMFVPLLVFWEGTALLLKLTGK